jgi:hypothetical protein
MMYILVFKKRVFFFTFLFQGNVFVTQGGERFFFEFEFSGICTIFQRDLNFVGRKEEYTFLGFVLRRVFSVGFVGCECCGCCFSLSLLRRVS